MKTKIHQAAAILCLTIFATTAFASKCDHSAISIINYSNQELRLIYKEMYKRSTLRHFRVGDVIKPGANLELEAFSGFGTWGDAKGKLVLAVGDTDSTVELDYALIRRYVDLDWGTSVCYPESKMKTNNKNIKVFSSASPTYRNSHTQFLIM